MAQVANSLGHWSLAGLRQCCFKFKTTAPRMLGTVRAWSQTSPSQALSTSCCKARQSYNTKPSSVTLTVSCLKFSASAANFSTANMCGRYNAPARPQGLTGSTIFQRTVTVFSKCQASASHRLYGSGGLLLQVEHLGRFRTCRRNFTSGTQKYVSALTAKRPLRKKTTRTAGKETEHADVVVGYAVAEELDLSQLREALQVQGLYHISELPVDAQDALHVQAKYAVDEKKREIFFFRDGSAVFWSMPEVERKEVLKFIRKHDNGRYSQSLILKEREEMDFKYIKGPTGIVGDTLELNEESEEGHMTLEKYAFSNALAQSVKLAVWESMLETFVDSIVFVTEELRDGQQIRMSRREVLRKTGELFTLRHLINLSSDLLDTPDFYWDRAVLEPLYMGVCNHLEISRRTRVMNEKLNHCCELMELLSSNLNDAHHTRLEVMIIVLILVEVVFEIVHYLERYYSTQASEADHLLGPFGQVAEHSSKRHQRSDPEQPLDSYEQVTQPSSAA